MKISDYDGAPVGLKSVVGVTMDIQVGDVLKILPKEIRPSKNKYWSFSPTFIDPALLPEAIRERNAEDVYFIREPVSVIVTRQYLESASPDLTLGALFQEESDEFLPINPDFVHG